MVDELYYYLILFSVACFLTPPIIICIFCFNKLKKEEQEEQEQEHVIYLSDLFKQELEFELEQGQEDPSQIQKNLQ